MPAFKRIISSMLAVLCIGAVTACGSGSAPAGLPAPAATAANGVITNAATRASLVVHVPNQSATTAGSTRRAQYVSASTQSIAVAIAPQTGCTGCSQAQTVSENLLPTGSNCTASPSGADCTVALALNAGTYTFNVTTFSGPVVAGAATGSALSVDTGLPVTIVFGQPNAIGVTLNGIPAGLAFTINTTDPTRAVVGSTLFAGPQGAIFAMTAAAVDAGGNLITGMGTTTISVVHTAGTPAAGITASAVPNSNIFGVTTGATGNMNVDVANVTMHGGNCALAGAVCTSALNLRFTQNIAVIDSGGVDIFTPWGTHIATVSNGVSQPNAVAFDQTGNLLVANKGTNTLTVYSSPYVAAPFATVAGILNPFKMVASRGGAVFIASAVSVFEVQPPYAAITTSLNGFNIIAGLATDRSNNLFVSDIGAHTTTEFSPPYVPQVAQTVYTAGLPSAAIAVNSLGVAFVGNEVSTVAEVSPAGAVLPQTITSTGGSQAQLAMDRNDNLAIMDGNAHGFDYAAAPAYTPAFVPLPVTAFGDFGVFDALGNLYIAGGAASIYSFTAPSMQAGPILTVPNGNTGGLAIWKPDP